LFILDGFHTLFQSYEFYFSNSLFIVFAILITAGRCCQILFKKRLRNWSFYLLELLIEFSRVIQLIFMVCIGTNTKIGNLFTTILWDKIFLGTNKIAFPEIVWSVIGFFIVFAIYNLIVHPILKKPLLIIGFKNLFLIPVAMIYILRIIHILS